MQMLLDIKLLMIVRIEDEILVHRSGIYNLLFKDDSENRTLAIGTLHSNLSTHHIYEGIGYGKSESTSFYSVVNLLLQTVKALEYLRNILFLNTHSGITDNKFKLHIIISKLKNIKLK